MEATGHPAGRETEFLMDPKICEFTGLAALQKKYPCFQKNNRFSKNGHFLEMQLFFRNNPKNVLARTYDRAPGSDAVTGSRSGDYRPVGPNHQIERTQMNGM